ncbi:MAG: nitrate reductase cytochrome c-type subunit [Sulfurospirillaceae bacterium]|nr:nitrate reductase cytochrome c-type subunit [Sulfurospirillaceae bacterium]
MKKINKITISLIAFGLFAAGCAVSNGSVSDTSLSLRKVNVQNENSIKLQNVSYEKAAPGTAKLIERSYDNAPPLIPHSVDGLVPITKDNNACLGCHMPEVAASLNATPIPKSHFTNFRPLESITKNGQLVKKGTIVAKANNGSNDVYATYTHGKLYAGRFNCTQCHVPQSNAQPLVRNTFKPDYMNKSQMKKSNLINTYDQGINTVQ